MALNAAEAAFNTAADVWKAAIKTYFDTLSAGDIVQLVAVDTGDTTLNDHSRTTTAAGAGVSFNKKVILEHVDDGDYPIQIPFGPGGELVPLVWKVTNSAEDLT